ncbi:hypothetical protein IW262DRAFT_1511047 [Armillaria fumosa]|nr:hypothetical protein IW262DRAFT_1511047 [Armillaria fumosa]
MALPSSGYSARYLMVVLPNALFGFRNVHVCEREDGHAEYVHPLRNMHALPKVGTAGILKSRQHGLGHACFLIELPFVPSLGRGATLAFDPVSKRYTELPFKIEEIPEVGAVVISVSKLPLNQTMAYTVDSIMTGCAILPSNRTPILGLVTLFKRTPTAHLRQAEYTQEPRAYTGLVGRLQNLWPTWRTKANTEY